MMANQKKVLALGRLKQGEMNSYEAAYAADLEARRIAGEIAWVKFEGLKFRLADSTFYTPDFAVMLAWRIGAQLQDGATLLAALRGSLVLALLAAVAIGILAALARMAASTAVYTLTDKRVVMRIGIVLTVTYNLPLKHIDAAHLLPLGVKKGGSEGEIALQLRGDTRIAYLNLWPHARPWLFAKPQPMLRCLADAQGVSRLLSEAWAAVNAQSARPEATEAAATDLALPAQGQAA